MTEHKKLDFEHNDILHCYDGINEMELVNKLKEVCQAIDEINIFINDARNAINTLMLDYNKRLKNKVASFMRDSDGKITPIFFDEIIKNCETEPDDRMD